MSENHAAMTAEQIDIARRLVASPQFPKMGDGWTWRVTDGPRHHRDTRGILWTDYGPWLPNLTDGGTGGVLLGMLSAEVAADKVAAVDAGYDGSEWWVKAWPGAEWVGLVTAPTLAEAAAVVLLEVLDA